MNYDEWLRIVDQILRADKRGITIKNIEEAALEAAFDADMSPVVFAKQTSLPLGKGPKADHSESFGSAKLWLVGGLVVLIVAWVARTQILDFRAERTLTAVKYPAKLPIRGEYGDFVPPLAHEAAEFAKEAVKPNLLTPRDVSYIEVTPTRALGEVKFEVEGIVSAKNKYGTAIESGFEMQLVKILNRNTWRVEKVTYGKSGDTNIWKEGAVPPKQLSKGASKYKLPRGSYLKDRGSVYMQDRE